MTEPITRDELFRRFPSCHSLSDIDLIPVEGATSLLHLRVEHGDSYDCNIDTPKLVQILKELLRQLAPTPEDRILDTLQRIECLLERRNE